MISHLPGFDEFQRFAEAGRKRVGFARQKRRHRLAAGVERQVVYFFRVRARGLESHRRHQMIHAARHRAAGDGEIVRAFFVKGDEIGKALDRAVGFDDKRGVVADDAGDRREIAETVRKPPDQRADDNRRRIDYQRVVVAGGVFDEIADGFAAAAARHVFVGRLSEQAGFCERFADSARGPVPAAAGAAGDEKMRFFRRLAPLAPSCRPKRK